jgi:hypothetical protein
MQRATLWRRASASETAVTSAVVTGRPGLYSNTKPQFPLPHHTKTSPGTARLKCADGSLSTSNRVQSDPEYLYLLNKTKQCKIWGFHGGDYEECRLVGYKTPFRTSQETHYVSSTKLGKLMLCKIWGFQGNDYEECRLLGYKNPVRTSQVTHYISATESSQLMLCKIWGFQGNDYEECRLLGYKNPVRTSQETHYVSATEPTKVNAM